MIHRFNLFIFIIAVFSSMPQTSLSSENISKAALTSKAMRGDINAQYDLCRFLHEEGSNDIAIGWCKKASMEGRNSDATLLLAWLLLNNSENKDDIKEGYIWLSIALAQKYNFSAFKDWKTLSASLKNDRKSSKRLSREINKLYRQYIDPKEKRDIFELISYSREQYISSLKKRADNNDAKAQTLLGVIYEHDGNLSAALKWYKVGAINGYINAQSYLGRSDSIYGIGKLLNNLERYSWLYLSLAQRYNYIDNLYLEFLKDNLSKDDIEKAKKNAQHLYATYADNTDLDILIKQSEKTYIEKMLSSERSLNNSRSNIKSYQTGLDILSDNSRILRQIVDRAKDGDIKTQYALGYMYAQGIEFPKDINESIKWYKKAAI